MNHKPWTEEEKEIVRQNIGSLGQLKVSKMLTNRSPQAVWRIAAAMGVKGRSLAEAIAARKPKWTPEQVELYREEFKVMGIKKFAKKYHMGKHTVTRLAQEHGMREGRDMRVFSAEELQQLRELAPTHTTTEIGKLMGRTTRSVQQKCSRLGIKCKGHHERRSPEPKPKLTPIKRVIVEVSRIHYCPDCYAPVSNWTEHFERMGHRAPWMRAA